MDQRPGETARRVLDSLADLSPAAEQRLSTLTIPTEWFRWLPAQAVRLFTPTAVLSEYAFQRRTAVEQRLGSSGLDRTLSAWRPSTRSAPPNGRYGSVGCSSPARRLLARGALAGCSTRSSRSQYGSNE